MICECGARGVGPGVARVEGRGARGVGRREYPERTLVEVFARRDLHIVSCVKDTNSKLNTLDIPVTALAVAIERTEH